MNNNLEFMSVIFNFISCACAITLVAMAYKYIIPRKLQKLRAHSTKCIGNIFDQNITIWVSIDYDNICKKHNISNDSRVQQINRMVSEKISFILSSAKKLMELYSSHIVQNHVKFDYTSDRVIVGDNLGKYIYEMQLVLVEIAHEFRKQTDNYICSNSSDLLILKIDSSHRKKYLNLYKEFIKLSEQNNNPF